MLEGLQVIDIYSRVTADVKVEKICEQETMTSGKKKQDVLIADGSGTAKVTL